jgi:hypothetical protein
MKSIQAKLCVKSELTARLIRSDGSIKDLGKLKQSLWRRVFRRILNQFGYVITDAGVSFMATDWLDATKDITNFNFHDSGTGTTAAAVGDTTLQTQAGPTTRATGTKSKPAANQIRSVGTISYTSTLAITEWGLFDQSAQGGTLWDRRVFAAINVVNGDSIQFTYTSTIASGG